MREEKTMPDLNERQFGDYRLRHEVDDATGGKPQHVIRAFSGEKDIGHMRWNPKEILGVDISPEHRRKGVATEMWNMGQGLRPKPKHSSDRTDEGDAWARSVGGRLPRRQQ